MDSERRYNLLAKVVVFVGVLFVLYMVVFVLLAVFAGHHTVSGYTPR
jgi:hypothetical protein